MKTRALSFVIAALVIVGTTLAQERYAVIVPAAASAELVDSAYRATAQIAYEASPGDVVELLDGTSPRSVARFTVPEGHKKRRAFLLKKSRGWTMAIKFLHGARAEGQKKEAKAQLDAVRIPQVLALLGARGEATRALLFAHPSYRMKDDPRHVFTTPHFPNDAFLRATPEESIFGTQGAEKELDGLTVFFCPSRSDWGSSLYQNQVQRFFALLVTGRGGTWGGLAADEGELVRNALKGAVPRWPDNWKLREEERVFAMRTVAGPEVRRAERPAPPAPARTVVVFITDGSISSQERLAVERAVYPRLALEWAKAANPVEAGVIVFRGAGAHDTYPATPLALLANGKAAPGLSGFQSFINVKDVEANASNFAKGSEVGVATGKTVKISKMEPLGAAVDTAFGIREGLRAFEDLRPVDTAYMVFCGDVDTRETHKGKEAVAENKKLVQEVRAFALLHPKAHVIALYSGKAKGPAQAFYEAFAAAAGERGVYLERADDLEPVLRSLVAKGAR